MKGEAEAFAIEAKAKAESEQMCKKADAWKEYEDAAKIEMMLDIIPKVGVWPVSYHWVNHDQNNKSYSARNTQRTVHVHDVSSGSVS